jgi:hypothetical protein
MPTSLPLTCSTALIEPAKSSLTTDPVWLVTVWAAAMLLFAAFTAGTGATDALPVIAF